MYVVHYERTETSKQRPTAVNPNCAVFRYKQYTDIALYSTIAVLADITENIVYA